jgi:hypothetical protein
MEGAAAERRKLSNNVEVMSGTRRGGRSCMLGMFFMLSGRRRRVSVLRARIYVLRGLARRGLLLPFKWCSVRQRRLSAIAVRIPFERVACARQSWAPISNYEQEACQSHVHGIRDGHGDPDGHARAGDADGRDHLDGCRDANLCRSRRGDAYECRDRHGPASQEARHSCAADGN